MRRSPPSHDTHEHEFLGEDADAEFDGDYVYVYQQCTHAPVISSVTDYSRDETYTETGPRCEAQKTVYVKVENPVNVETEHEVEYDETPELWEQVVFPVEDEIMEEALVEFSGPDPAKQSVVTSQPEGFDEYEIELVRDEVNINR